MEKSLICNYILGMPSWILQRRPIWASLQYPLRSGSPFYFADGGNFLFHFYLLSGVLFSGSNLHQLVLIAIPHAVRVQRIVYAFHHVAISPSIVVFAQHGIDSVSVSLHYQNY